MTVEELIEELMKCNPKSNVFADQQYDGESLVQGVMPDKSRDKVVLKLDY